MSKTKNSAWLPEGSEVICGAKLRAAYQKQGMHGRIRKFYRTVAIIEALTWGGLLVGMAFKYLINGNQIGVRVFGSLHGEPAPLWWTPPHTAVDAVGVEDVPKKEANVHPRVQS